MKVQCRPCQVRPQRRRTRPQIRLRPNVLCMIMWQRYRSASDVRVGAPLPLGTYERGEGVNFAFFSRHATRVRLELFDHPEDATAARVIDLDPARNRTGIYGTSGLKGSVPVNSMPIAWMVLTNPAKDIVSISTSCSWIHLRQRSRRCLIGILARPVDMIRRRRSETWLFESR